MEEIPYRRFSWRTHKKNWLLNKPNVCQFELTFKCDIHCRHCYTDCYNRPVYLKKELNLKEVKFILDKVYKAGVIWVCFTGGDPLTRKDFLDIYSYAKEKGFIVTVFTNGYSVTEDVVRYFKRRPPFVIEITLNAVTEGLYEKISRVKGSFNKVMQGINLILKAKLPLKIKTQITRDNLEELPRIEKFIRGLGLRFRPSTDLYARLNSDLTPCNLRISPREVLGLNGKKQSADEECILRHTPQVIRHTPDASRHTPQANLFEPLGSFSHRGAHPEERSDEGSQKILPRFARQDEGSNIEENTPTPHLFNCAVGGGDGIHIDPYGNTFACNLIRKPVFNLLKVDIDYAVNKLLPLLRNRKFVTNSRCNGCNLRKICHCCPGRAYVETADMEKPIDYYCELAEETAK